MYPFFNRALVTRLDRVIPKLITISISENTTSVALGICPKVWCQLPCEGVVVLEVRQSPTTAGATLPVFISTTGSVSPAANNNNIPLVNAESAPIVGSQISAGNRYLVYYNKCERVMQIMNYTPATTAAA